MMIKFGIFLFILSNLSMFNFSFAGSENNSGMMLNTIRCSKPSQDSWNEHVLVMYEPWPIKCDQEFNSRPGILALSTRRKKEGSGESAGLPLIQYLGTFKRNKTGGFEFSIVSEGQTYKVELKNDESETVGDAGLYVDGFSNCSVASFRNFCN